MSEMAAEYHNQMVLMMNQLAIKMAIFNLKKEFDRE